MLWHGGERVKTENLSIERRFRLTIARLIWAVYQINFPPYSAKDSSLWQKICTNGIGKIGSLSIFWVLVLSFLQKCFDFFLQKKYSSSIRQLCYRILPYIVQLLRHVRLFAAICQNQNLFSKLNHAGLHLFPRGSFSSSVVHVYTILRPKFAYKRRRGEQESILGVPNGGCCKQRIFYIDQDHQD